MSKKAPESSRSNFLRQFRDANSNEIKKLTASQFMEIWNHYDCDSNGFLEGPELDMFLSELCTSVSKINSTTSKDVIPESLFEEFKEDILEAYDEDGDGRISVHELAEILPTEENFLFLFRLDNWLNSTSDFMKIWIDFDKNGSGYIEIDELRDFVAKLLEKNQNKTAEVTDKKLDEYTESILKIFDSNGDGKLQLSEMIKYKYILNHS